MWVRLLRSRESTDYLRRFADDHCTRPHWQCGSEAVIDSGEPRNHFSTARSQESPLCDRARAPELIGRGDPESRLCKARTISLPLSELRRRGRANWRNLQMCSLTFRERVTKLAWPQVAAGNDVGAGFRFFRGTKRADRHRPARYALRKRPRHIHGLTNESSESSSLGCSSRTRRGPRRRGHLRFRSPVAGAISDRV
jgi:hypothetical protein